MDKFRPMPGVEGQGLLPAGGRALHQQAQRGLEIARHAHGAGVAAPPGLVDLQQGAPETVPLGQGAHGVPAGKAGLGQEQPGAHPGKAHPVILPGVGGLRGVAGRNVGADEEGIPRPQDESPVLQLQRPPAGDHIVDQIVVPDAGPPSVARRTLLKSRIVDHQRQLRPVRRLEGVLEALRHIRDPSPLQSHQQHTARREKMQLKSMERRRE